VRISWLLVLVYVILPGLHPLNAAESNIYPYRHTAHTEITQTQPTDDPDEVYTGFMSNAVPDDHYPLSLSLGEGVIITAEATSGSLDTYLILLDSDGNRVAENDDRDRTTLDSELVYITPTGGEYTIVMTNISGTAGDYRLSVWIVPAEDAEPLLRVQLSGPVFIHDTEHFRIHYTLEGEDATTHEFARLVGEAFEESRYIQVEQLGWPAPPDDGMRGGDNRYDVYLMNIIDDLENGGELGSAAPELPYGDNPNSPVRQEFATASYIIMDNDYSGESVQDGRDSIGLMRATAAHEFHHAIQFGFDGSDKHKWYYEATSSWMETITFPAEQDATGYVELVFTYPEICLGAAGDADPSGGQLMYGTWLFIQSLADAHGKDAIIRLWENIGIYEGWRSLEETLTAYRETIPQAAIRYHIQNLVRDYAFTPEFEADTVWLENAISRTGEWTFTGLGVQELAANYFKMLLPGGHYNVTLRDAADSLELWMVGIKGGEAAAIPLGRGGSVVTTPYQNVYLIVFNTDFNDDVYNCTYSSYTLDIQPGQGTTVAPAFVFNARYYEPLR
jgi:hypothetical protein